MTTIKTGSSGAGGARAAGEYGGADGGSSGAADMVLGRVQRFQRAIIHMQQL